MKINRFATVILATLAMLCVFTTSTFATDSNVQPRFSDFSSVYAGLYDQGNNIFVIEGNAATPNANKKVYITLSLEKANGNRWEVMPGCTWTASGMIMAQTSAMRSLSKSAYRAHTYAEVYLGDTLLETADAYSYVKFVD